MAGMAWWVCASACGSTVAPSKPVPSTTAGACSPSFPSKSESWSWRERRSLALRARFAGSNRPEGDSPGGGCPMSVRLLIADDQALVRAGFRMILDAEDDLEVVGEAADGLDA